MNIQELLSDIMRSGEEESVLFRKETQQMIAKYDSETMQLLQRRRAEMHAEVKKQEEALKLREESRQQLARQMQEAKYRQELLEQAFQQALQELASLSGERRVKLIEKLWSRAVAQIAIAQVDCATKDKTILAKKTKIGKTIDSAGGFIASNESGSVTIDMRFETILEHIRSTKRAEIAKVLFGGKR